MEGLNILVQYSDLDALNSLIGGSIVLFFIILAFIIALLVVYIIGAVKLYQKAGKPGWAAIVPFYSTYVLTEIAGLYWWYFLIGIAGSIFNIAGLKDLSGLATIASGIFNFFVFYNIAKKFNKNPIEYAILAIFFAPIMVMILGFTKNATYDSNIEVSPNGPVGDSTISSSNEPERFCLGCGRKLKPNAKFCENCGKEVKE